MKSTCPICRKVLESDKQSGPFPFCSWRCKKLDLYRWLHEEYRISEPAEFASSLALGADDEVNQGEAPV